jgi:hypothetical protein
MRVSGAEKVLWIRTTEDHLVDLMKKALDRVGDTRGILIEGNTILRYINPTLACFVTTATIDNMKTSRIQALEKADLCVLNIKDTVPNKYAFGEQIKRLNPSLELFSFNLIDKTHRSGTECKRFIAFVQDCLT